MPGATFEWVTEDTLCVTASQSWMNTFLKCPERARRQLLDLEVRIVSDAMAVGTALHTGPETLLAGGSLQDAHDLAEATFVELSSEPDFQWIQVRTEKTALAYIHNAVDSFHRFVQPLLEDIVAIEKSIEAELGRRELWDPINRRTVYVILKLAGTPDIVTVSPFGFHVWDWKGLAVDTPMLTPDGWTDMGSLKVGDRVFGSDGHSTTVTAKSEVHERPCYRVVFDDGTSIIADNVHLWEVLVGQRTRKQVLSTEQLLEHAGKLPIRIANPAPLQLPDTDLPLDPYLLGVWLGDGATSAPKITVGRGDEETLKYFLDSGFELGHVSGIDYYIMGLRSSLRQIGVLGNKHVPMEYLMASEPQRLALLQGLMDTDGSWSKLRDNAIFTNTNANIASAVWQLVLSLGCKASLHTGQPKYPNAKPFWNVSFTPPPGLQPFRLARKASLVSTPAKYGKYSHRYIRAIDPVDTVPTQCIAVDAPDHLYLAGRQMVPTHNTANRPYEQWEVDRFYLQPSAYTYLVSEWLSEPPVDFTYAVFPKAPDVREPQLLPTTRDEGDWAWMREQLFQVVDTWLRTDEGTTPWAYTNLGWWCSAKWCNSWDQCRGGIMRAAREQGVALSPNPSLTKR